MVNLFAEGVYIDMWTVPHLLFGCLLFLFLVNKKVKTNYSILILLFLAIFWEFFEMRARVEEFFTNRIVDVLITLVGFYILYFINKKTGFMHKNQTRDTVWRYTLGFWVLLNALGWMSYMFL